MQQDTSVSGRRRGVVARLRTLAWHMLFVVFVALDVLLVVASIVPIRLP